MEIVNETIQISQSIQIYSFEDIMYLKSALGQNFFERFKLKLTTLYKF